MNKLFIFAPSFHPVRGGVEQHLRRVCEGLTEHGWNVTVGVRYNPSLPRLQHLNDVRVIRMPKHDNFIVLLLWFILHSRLLLQVQAVHSHDYFPFIIRRLLPRKRWVHTFHGYEGYPVSKSAIKSRQKVRALVPYCFGVGEFIEKWYGTPCDAWLYGAADASLARQKAEVIYDCVFYGRLEDDTGFRTYLKAFRKISKDSPGTSLLVVGSGSHRQWAESYVKQHNLKVKFNDSTPDVIPLAASAKVAFVSGYLAILECALLSKPIISLYETPIKKDYLLCHPMAKHLAIASNEDEIYEHYRRVASGTNGSDTLKRWALQQTWEKITSVYIESYK